MALNGLFILITKHGLEYPDFYNKLYALLEPSIFVAKHRARFFEVRFPSYLFCICWSDILLCNCVYLSTLLKFASDKRLIFLMWVKTLGWCLAVDRDLFEINSYSRILGGCICKEAWSTGIVCSTVRCSCSNSNDPQSFATASLNQPSCTTGELCVKIVQISFFCMRFFCIAPMSVSVSVFDLLRRFVNAKIECVSCNFC